MAIKPNDLYPNQTNMSDLTGYPLGKAQNVVTPGDNKGTPWKQEIVNDLFGFWQALLAAANITASGTPDKVGASQYLQAIQSLVSSGVAGGAYKKHAAYAIETETLDAGHHDTPLIGTRIPTTNTGPEFLYDNTEFDFRLSSTFNYAPAQQSLRLAAFVKKKKNSDPFVVFKGTIVFEGGGGNSEVFSTQGTLAPGGTISFVPLKITEFTNTGIESVVSANNEISYRFFFDEDQDRTYTDVDIHLEGEYIYPGNVLGNGDGTAF